jgi:hypothetical protein
MPDAYFIGPVESVSLLQTNEDGDIVPHVGHATIEYATSHLFLRVSHMLTRTT